MAPIRERFDGHIAGMGSASGVRIVVGRWSASPLGAFGDVMLEQADGHRVLYAPSPEVAGFIEATYVFDEVRMGPVTIGDQNEVWTVRAGDLALRFVVGRRPPLGWLLRSVPRRLATSPRWATAIDPLARRAVRGVRTRGVARQGRREWYGATDLRTITELDGSLSGVPLGALRPVDPPCRFGFSSTPRRPSVTTVVTTVERACGPGAREGP